MRLNLFLAALSCNILDAFVSGFSVGLNSQCWGRSPSVRTPFPSPTYTALQSSAMESDFETAMPPKPELSMEERLVTSAEDFILSMRSSLGDGVEEPLELTALEEALESNADPGVLALKIYELMIERGMKYDVAPETGTLTPTQFDIPSNLDDETVKKEFLHLYTYGMGLIQRGIIDLDDAKKIIQDRLITRTGLSAEKFDEWMGF